MGCNKSLSLAFSYLAVQPENDLTSSESSFCSPKVGLLQVYALQVTLKIHQMARPPPPPPRGGNCVPQVALNIRPFGLQQQKELNARCERHPSLDTEQIFGMSSPDYAHSQSMVCQARPSKTLTKALSQAWLGLGLSFSNNI